MYELDFDNSIDNFSKHFFKIFITDSNPVVYRIQIENLTTYFVIQYYFILYFIFNLKNDFMIIISNRYNRVQINKIIRYFNWKNLSKGHLWKLNTLLTTRKNLRILLRYIILLWIWEFVFFLSCSSDAHSFFE